MVQTLEKFPVQQYLTAAPLIMTSDLNSLAKRGVEASVTAPMPVQSSASAWECTR